MVTVTVFNGDRIIRHLQITRRFRWIGAGVGTALAAAVMVHDGSVSPYFPITGWFLGGVAAEFSFARFRPRIRRPHGMCLSSSLLVGIWRFSAVLSAAVALSTVVRSFRMDVGVAERGWAVLALGVVLAVHLLLRHLDGTPVPQGPADLVTAEFAIRSRSARTLLAGGTAVALWTASRCGLPELPSGLRGSPELFATVLPIFAWLLAAIPPWQVTAAARRRLPAALPAALPAVIALLLLAGLLIRWESPDPAPGADDRTGLAAAPLVRALSRPVESARRRPGADGWELLLGPYDGVVLTEAEARLPGRRPQGRPGPLALSGDGHHVAYLDRRSRRMVALELTTLRRVHLTRPLADAAVPGVALSSDGRHAVLTSGAGSELVDTRTGSRAVLRGVRRILGVGPGGVTVGTTGGEALPGSPDTALLTLDAGGRELARVPFDPTLKARLSPDGRTLAVVSPSEVVTMDPATGRVRGRAPLDLPGVERDPDVVGWSAGGHLLVRSDSSNLDEAVHHLVDPATGRARLLEDLTGSVFGRLS